MRIPEEMLRQSLEVEVEPDIPEPYLSLWRRGRELTRLEKEGVKFSELDAREQGR